MSDMAEQHKLTSQLDRDDALVILQLIDLKAKSDMDKVLNKLDSMEKGFNAQLFALNNRLDNLDKSVDVRIASFEKSVNAQFKALHWVIGIFFAIAVAAAKFL